MNWHLCGTCGGAFIYISEYCDCGDCDGNDRDCINRVESCPDCVGGYQEVSEETE